MMGLTLVARAEATGVVLIKVAGMLLLPKTTANPDVLRNPTRFRTKQGGKASEPAPSAAQQS
jgi:hypothetical protein